MSRTREIIVRLLENIGGRKEVSEYLRHYTSVDSQRFAVITFAPDIDVGAQAEDIAGALSFLHQVGLRPIVLVEGQLARAADGAQEPRGREAARRATQRDVLALTDALETRESRVRPITSGVFIGLGAPDAAEVVAIDDAPVLAAIRADQLPIIGLHAASEHGEPMTTTMLSAVSALTRHLEPRKIILLEREGGLSDRNGTRLDAINLAEDYATVIERLSPEGRLRLDSFQRLLERLPRYASLSVTSPAHLARELFTHRGAGTLVRRGEPVNAYPDFSQVDRERLRQLLETCFGRELAPGYFDDKNCQRVYVTENYRATAIITREGDAPPYLDKFAVTKKAQGEGLGGSVWDRMRRDHPRLFWRAQSGNPINTWYFEQAEGTYRAGRWTVFWYGIDEFREIESCVKLALSLPATLRDHGTPA